MPTVQRSKLGASLLGGLGVAALTLGLVGSDGASAYVGPSFAKIPGIVGGARAPEHKNWLQIEAHYWHDPEAGLEAIGRRLGRGLVFPGSYAPPSGSSELVVAVSKKSAGLSALMARCKSGAAIPELTFAESSELIRVNATGVLGPMPEGVPDFIEHRLKNVVVRGCGVDPAAPEQALILKFDNIEWLNFKPGPVPAPLPAAQLAPLDPGGDAMTFVVHWLAIAGDVSEDQCPAMNDRPPDSEYYRLMDPTEAAKEKAANDAMGGVNLENGQMEWRGPNKTNVSRLPGVVRDPGHILVRTNVARGVDLDGHDGTGAPPAGICAHKNFVSDDGRKGIDNQLFRVQGCIRAYEGHKGFYQQYKMEQKRNGRNALLVQISGIDDAQNDDRVQVTLVHSRDPMTKSADGSKILAHYTYRVADDPLLNFFATRLNGRIENGVISTEPTAQLHIQDASAPVFHQARLRLQVMPDGSLKGIVAGYQDWRRVRALAAGSNQEQLYGLTLPGMYNAMRREADGLKDPVTGQCWGISSVFDIEGSRAFVSPAPARFAMARETRFGIGPFQGPLASARQTSR